MDEMRVPQPMRPRGAAGRFVGWIMTWMNAPACRVAAEIIAPSPGWAVLEIGFGPGVLLRLLAERMGPACSPAWRLRL